MEGLKPLTLNREKVLSGSLSEFSVVDPEGALLDMVVLQMGTGSDNNIVAFWDGTVGFVILPLQFWCP